MAGESDRYDERNPWHVHINIVFCLMCDRCGHVEDMEWGGGDDAFLGECVKLADKAQAEGWKRHDEKFYCPECVGKMDGR